MGRTASSFVFFVKTLNIYEDLFAVDFHASVFLVLGVGVVLGVLSVTGIFRKFVGVSVHGTRMALGSACLFLGLGVVVVI